MQPPDQLIKIVWEGNRRAIVEVNDKRAGAFEIRPLHPRSWRPYVSWIRWLFSRIREPRAIQVIEIERSSCPRYFHEKAIWQLFSECLKKHEAANRLFVAIPVQWRSPLEEVLIRSKDAYPCRQADILKINDTLQIVRRYEIQRPN